MKNPTQSAKRITPFQESVYAALQGIPAGFVTTYGTIAKLVGCGSSQAIGQALRNNPFAPTVPCHRVVRNDGSLGGYFGNSSVQGQSNKQRLLEEEGIVFDTAGIVPERFIIRTGTAGSPPHSPENSPERPAGAGR
jgi:methylated-DNA-[protein]-cysteine S-methyltransferase